MYKNEYQNENLTDHKIILICIESDPENRINEGGGGARSRTTTENNGGQENSDAITALCHLQQQ